MSYKGITGHEKQGEINALIIKSRFGGAAWKDIQSVLKQRFGIEISHTLLISYYNNSLNGEVLDECKGIAIATAYDGENDGDFKGEKSSEIDPQRLNELQKKYDKQGNNPLGALYAKILCLYESNLQAHTQNKERLNSTYLKHLKELGSIIGQKKPNEF